MSSSNGYNATRARQRLPTLFEVLNRRTQSPVDLWSFYVFMREQYRGVDYLDFWLDVIQHLSLCRHYVRGLRQSILASSERAGGDNSSSRTSSVLLDTLIQEGGLNDTDSHRLSAFLRGEDASQGNSETLYRLSALLDAMNTKEHDLADLHAPPSRGENFISRVNASTRDNDDEGSEGGEKRSPVAPGPSSGFTDRGSHDDRSFYSPMHSPLQEQQQQQLLTRDEQQRASVGDYDYDEKHVSGSGSGGGQQHVSLNAETIERLFPRRQGDIDDGSSYVTREDIRQSSHRILVTYFIPGAEREIVLPQHIMKSVKHAIEIDGRDDPEVFDEAREYVFQAMEREAFPAFLAAKALGNVTPLGSLIRMIVGLVAIFAAFWVAFILIFLDWSPKVTRLWLILPFGVAAYAIFSSLYNLDPLMAIMGFSESSASSNKVVRIKEPYVQQLLVKRSCYVFAVIVLVAAIFVIIFALVPGKRL
ncbi:hypothetical protein TRICI_003041 [Trichomonascus ciferrii]|uniref:RGS domain-containing protein n=1 Tax=Trichomonascus ciferrii TaxID=44093 RepID=A0A642V479_9ASCO|nr:hypothetical protein TRICI_003041 [Trichomonascus ciferrii]